LEDTVEVEVMASRPFPDRAMPPVLVIGDRAFGRSRNPPDGRPDTLIFTIDARDFEALADDSEVTIGFLSSSARLSSPVSPGAGAARASASGPHIRPDQVEKTKRRVGKFRKAAGEVVP